METMAWEMTAWEFIEGQRKKLLVILQQDPDSVLDALISRSVISGEEYETLDRVTDPLKKSRKLLILVQKKGEMCCQRFLRCLFNTFPESAPSWDLKLEFFQHKNIAPQCIGVNKNSENTISSVKKEPGNPMITASSSEKQQSCLETSEFFPENGKECQTPNVTLPCPIGKADSEVPVTITYLRDGQRYEEPDDSLYLGAEDYEASVGFPEDTATSMEEGVCNEAERIVCGGEEEPEYSEAVRSSDEEDHYDDSETSFSLEEEEKILQENKKIFKDVLSSLNMDRSRKLLPDFVKQFSLDRGSGWTPKTPADLVWNFLMKVQALDVTARDSVLRHKILGEVGKEVLLTRLENLEMEDTATMNPLDVLCASLLCADSSLQRQVMSNMYQCQFALPLLLPDAENNKSILMLGAMEDVVERQSPQSSVGPTGARQESLRVMKLPVISFVRLGHCSFSKSKILNTLLSSDQLKPHIPFLHQDVSVPVLPRQISDGLLEITWCFPDNDHLKEGLNISHKPFAVTNLRGDLERFWTQFSFMMEVSAAVFFFTDSLGEKQWDLLMFLGEIAIERCYFVLSPQARESEEAQMFQRMLNLKSSQLLFWEGEESGDRRKNMEALRAALQEVTASSLRGVSVEEMASLARELGIQVDQDLETDQGIQASPRETDQGIQVSPRETDQEIQVSPRETDQGIQASPRENIARAAEDEGQQKCSQLKSSSESQAQIPLGKSGPIYEVSQNIQNVPSAPVFPSHQENSPLPTPVGGNFNCISLKAPQVMGSKLGSEHRPRWFWPLIFQSRSAHRRAKSFGIKSFQPQKSYSGEKSMKLSRTPWGHHLNGTFGRPPNSISQCAWAWGGKPRITGAPRKPGVSQAGDPHSTGSLSAGAVGKAQPGRACAPGTQLMGAAHIPSPHPQPCKPAGALQKLARPTFHQGPQMMTQDRPSTPVLQSGSHPIPRSKLLHSSQFKPHQLISSQVKPSQTKPFQPVPSQIKPPQSQSSQAKPFHSTSHWLQSSQAKPSPSKPPQPKPCQSQRAQSKTSQPRSVQHKSSWSSPSQAKANQTRAGPKRMGKH
ncbi:caspase recruitment domain-containing protein 6 isoform X1 [Dipodomys spectabilis]|uniref:caspase recruitment domain-containing protein 6 isoform X1 n=1 Tax=Dipodomys spectabilis TaxID=105255 RepID=UPI001C54B272|nr:caspase recruitment domain-containing protein 6 isoform X1 [Dipodomys spectabilis]